MIIFQQEEDLKVKEFNWVGRLFQTFSFTRPHLLCGLIWYFGFEPRVFQLPSSNVLLTRQWHFRYFTSVKHHQFRRLNKFYVFVLFSFVLFPAFTCPCTMTITPLDKWNNFVKIQGYFGHLTAHMHAKSAPPAGRCRLWRPHIHSVSLFWHGTIGSNATCIIFLLLYKKLYYLTYDNYASLSTRKL